MNSFPIARGALCIVMGAALLSACTSVPIPAEQCRANSATAAEKALVNTDAAGLAVQGY
jgi:hypothetical protein